MNSRWALIAEAAYLHVRSAGRNSALRRACPIACTCSQRLKSRARVALGVHCRCRMSDEKPVPDTLESIASQIRELSTSIDGRFAQVDGRSEQIDGRFAQIDTRFDQIDTRFDQIDTRFDQIDARLRPT